MLFDQKKHLLEDIEEDHMFKLNVNENTSIFPDIRAELTGWTLVKMNREMKHPMRTILQHMHETPII